MKIVFAALWFGGAILSIACVDDDDRCGNLTWDPESAICIAEPADSEVETDKDAGEDSDAEPVLGETCKTDTDCAVYNADYCLVVPPETEGTCTLRDCAVDPDDCPSGYACCISPGGDAFYPDHCMPEDVFEQMGEFLCEQ